MPPICVPLFVPPSLCPSSPPLTAARGEEKRVGGVSRGRAREVEAFTHDRGHAHLGTGWK